MESIELSSVDPDSALWSGGSSLVDGSKVHRGQGCAQPVAVTVRQQHSVHNDGPEQNSWFSFKPSAVRYFIK